VGLLEVSGWPRLERWIARKRTEDVAAEGVENPHFSKTATGGVFACWVAATGTATAVAEVAV